MEEKILTQIFKHCKRYTKILDRYFCTPSEPKTDQGFKLKKEHYRLCFAYIIIQYFSKNLGFLSSAFTISQQLEILLIVAFHLYLLHQRKLERLQAMIVIVYIIPALIMIEIHSSVLLLAIPIMLIGFCLYCLIITCSFLWASISYCLNTYLIVTIYRPKIFQALNCVPGDNMYVILDTMISCSISCALLVNIIVGLLIESRRRLLKKVLKQKNDLELSNKELLRINNELKSSLKSNETFIFNVSHELRNPLNNVLGNVELALMNKKIDKVLKNLLLNAKSSGEMLVHLINNLLDFGKLQNNMLEISPNPTKIKDYLEKAWLAIRILIQKQNLSGRLYLDKKLPETLKIDSHRVRQILFNLIDNASKFTDEGCIIVTISWLNNDSSQEKLFSPTKINSKKPKQGVLYENQLADNNVIDYIPSIEEFSNVNEETPNERSKEYSFSKIILQEDYLEFDNNSSNLMNPKLTKYIEKRNNSSAENKEGFLKIEVKDTGCGINNDDLSKIFKKFTQVGNHIEKKGQGFGLGLWVTKKLCMSMGGDIKSYSKIGKGSKFVSVIRCARCESPIEPLEEYLIEDESTKNVLVVENKTNQEINKYFLEKCGVKVTDIADNEKEALQIIKSRGKNFFKIIFMDLDKPLLKENISLLIREYEEKNGWNPVILIIVTGYCNKYEYNDYLDSNGLIKANYIFSKPFTFEQCRDVISQINQKEKIFQESENNNKKLSEIMIVDDDAFNMMLMQEYMIKMKIGSVIARNCKDAVDVFQNEQNHVSMIFMDCKMSIINGFEAIKEIKSVIKKKGWKDIPIIGLTEDISIEAKKKCIDAGMINFLNKPVTFEIIMKIAKNELD